MTSHTPAECFTADGHDFIPGDVEGVRTLFVVPTIPDGASSALKDALARRRLATVAGRCPCGAQRPPLPRQARRAMRRGAAVAPAHVLIEHEDGCPATNEALRVLFAEHDA